MICGMAHGIVRGALLILSLVAFGVLSAVLIAQMEE